MTVTCEKVIIFAVLFLLSFLGECAAQVYYGSIPVYLPNRRRHPTKWGEWGEWEGCSRTCGEGVSKRTRSCMVYDGHGYRTTYLSLCSGRQTSYQICNTGNCPSGSLDYRHWQCLTSGKLLTITSGPTSVTWAPAHGGRPCELTCRSSLGWVHTLGSVADGTRCYDNPSLKHVCVRGRCKKVGCDGVVGSRARHDVCGKCSRAGQRTTCFLVADTYLQPFADRSTEFPNYNLVIEVPKGATYLYIQENTTNLIALSDENGLFILNGPQFTSKNGVYKVDGVNLTYTRGDGSPLVPETLESVGPLASSVTIMLMMKERNTGVYYHFWEPSTDSLNAPAPLRRFGYSFNFPPLRTLPPPPTRPTTTTTTTSTTTTPTTTTTTTPTTTTTTTPTTTTTTLTPTRRTTKRPLLTRIGGSPWNPDRPDRKDSVIWNLVMERLLGDDLLLKPPHTHVNTHPVTPDNDFTGSLGNNPGNVGIGGSGHDHFGLKGSREENSLGKSKSDIDIEETFGETSHHNGEIGGSSNVDIGGGSNVGGNLDVGGLGNANTNLFGESDIDAHNGQLGSGRTDNDVFEGTHINGQLVTTTSPPMVNSTQTPQCSLECKQIKDRAYHFCDSDFVSRMKILEKTYVGGQTRYVVITQRTYKARRTTLLPREFIWAPNLCDCPRMRVGKSYVIMGFTQRHLERQSKLIVTPSAYVRRYSRKMHQRMMALQGYVKC